MKFYLHRFNCKITLNNCCGTIFQGDSLTFKEFSPYKISRSSLEYVNPRKDEFGYLRANIFWYFYLFFNPKKQNPEINENCYPCVKHHD